MYHLTERKRSVEEVPRVHGEHHQLGNLNPTQAQFKVVEFTPVNNFNQGQLDNLTVSDLTMLLNNQTCTMALILSFQCAMEASIRRAKIANDFQQSYALINFNVLKPLTPDIDDSLRGFSLQTAGLL